MDELYRLFGKFAFHLYSTHGIPLEIFKERFNNQPHSKLFKSMLKHRDFKSKYGE